MAFFDLFRKRLNRLSWDSIRNRSQHERDRLTDEEGQFMARTGCCPDCGNELVAGPRGGLAQNVCCVKCHSEFNVTLYQGGFMGQRISEPGPRELSDRAWAYKL